MWMLRKEHEKQPVQNDLSLTYFPSSSSDLRISLDRDGTQTTATGQLNIKTKNNSSSNNNDEEPLSSYCSYVFSVRLANCLLNRLYFGLYNILQWSVPQFTQMI